MKDKTRNFEVHSLKSGQMNLHRRFHTKKEQIHVAKDMSRQGHTVAIKMRNEDESAFQMVYPWEVHIASKGKMQFHSRYETRVNQRKVAKAMVDTGNQIGVKKSGEDKLVMVKAPKKAA